MKPEPYVFFTRRTRAAAGALILISALTLALTGCSALRSSGLSCDNEPSPPPDVTAPVDDIAQSVRTLDGVREVRPIFSQQAPGPCANAQAYADEPWQSELQVTMIGTATAAQIDGAVTHAAAGSANM